MKESKSMMNWVFLGLVIAVVVLAFNSGKTPVNITSQGEVQKNTITVSGSGEVEVMPDEANIYIRVVNEGTNANDVQDENKEMSNNVIKALKAKGVKSDEIETSRYSLNPKYTWDSKDGQQIIGYEAQHVLKVKTNDIENTGDLIDAAVNSGANSIQDVQFVLSDDAEREFNKDALAEASGNAKDKADAIADSLSVRVAGLSRVSESSVGYSPYRYDYAVMEMADAGGKMAMPTSISPEKVTVSASVTLVYEIG
jgi:uncharacterized protein YggE